MPILTSEDCVQRRESQPHACSSEPVCLDCCGSIAYVLAQHSLLIIMMDQYDLESIIVHALQVAWACESNLTFL